MSLHLDGVSIILKLSNVKLLSFMSCTTTCCIHTSNILSTAYQDKSFQDSYQMDKKNPLTTSLNVVTFTKRLLLE